MLEEESQRFLHRRSQSFLMRKTKLLPWDIIALYYPIPPLQMCLGAVRFSRVYVKVLRSRVKRIYSMRASKSITLSFFSSPTNFELLLCCFMQILHFNLIYILRNQDVIFHRSPPAAFPASWQNLITISTSRRGVWRSDVRFTKPAFMLSQHSQHLHNITAHLHPISPSVT